MKQKLFNFDLTEHMSKFDYKELLKFSVQEIYIERKLNNIYKNNINAYKTKKLGIYKNEI